jgi:hydrogenase 3 maturation protease
VSSGLERALRKWLTGMKRLAIVGIGNRLRGDDAVGVEVISRLRGKTGDNVLLIDAETTPEFFTDVISNFNPTHILFVDAARFNKEAGFRKLVKVEEIERLNLSTHSISLRTLTEYLKMKMNFQVSVALLGIQPKCLEFKEGLSVEARRAVDESASLLLRVISSAQPTS